LTGGEVAGIGMHEGMMKVGHAQRLLHAQDTLSLSLGRVRFIEVGRKHTQEVEEEDDDEMLEEHGNPASIRNRRSKSWPVVKIEKHDAAPIRPTKARPHIPLSACLSGLPATGKREIFSRLLGLASWRFLTWNVRT
jgi:hypothetical protein